MFVETEQSRVRHRRLRLLRETPLVYKKPRRILDTFMQLFWLTCYYYIMYVLFAIRGLPTSLYFELPISSPTPPADI